MSLLSVSAKRISFLGKGNHVMSVWNPFNDSELLGVRVALPSHCEPWAVKLAVSAVVQYLGTTVGCVRHSLDFSTGTEMQSVCASLVLKHSIVSWILSIRWA